MTKNDKSNLRRKLPRQSTTFSNVTLLPRLSYSEYRKESVLLPDRWTL